MAKSRETKRRNDSTTEKKVVQRAETKKEIKDGTELTTVLEQAGAVDSKGRVLNNIAINSQAERVIEQAQRTPAVETTSKQALIQNISDQIVKLDSKQLSEVLISNPQFREQLQQISVVNGKTWVSAEQTKQSYEAEIKKLNTAKDNLEVNLRNTEQKLREMTQQYDALSRSQKADESALKTQVASLMTEKTTLQKDLNLQKERLNASFTSQELADYLNEAIVDFNNKMNQASENVFYTINTMDVNLKAQIVKQNDKLGFITTTTTGEAALSDIHFSIVATSRS